MLPYLLYGSTTDFSLGGAKAVTDYKNKVQPKAKIGCTSSSSKITCHKNTGVF